MSRRILVVEDQADNRQILNDLLTSVGYEIIHAENGEEALAAAATKHPDLILMDVALGEMDGWESTQLIKANPATAAIPIIALTAHALASDRAKSVEVGCSDFDTKPVDLQRLLAKMRTFLPAVDQIKAHVATAIPRAIVRMFLRNCLAGKFHRQPGNLKFIRI